MNILNIPSYVLDQAIESAVADLGQPQLTLSAINADLKYHTKCILMLRNDLRDLARKYSRDCVKVDSYQSLELTNEYDTARAVLQERQDDHKAAVTRLERAKSKYLFCLDEVTK
ncbi:hypothetical protein IDAT_01030 [Pseudidiomarina atlantica]|uniref:Uncharacterized protein n=1 Tax=Pseudidiomarina atlantica TaxID=1517416 RepID=A0A094IRF9_9GAMM|nr:hypothetical protein IDAT_01030 [Pseudidiomarina atlantica]